MSDDFQKSPTCQALTRLLVDYLRQREQLLAQTCTSGPFLTEEDRQASIALDRIDAALTDHGYFDTGPGHIGDDDAP